MKNRNGYGILIISFICFSALACHQPESPEYLGLQNIMINKLDAQQSMLTGSVKFYNPNNFNMQLKKAEIDVFINDQAANHFALDTTIEIHAKDTFWIPVTMKLDLKSLLANALQSLLNDEVKIRLEGSARVKKGGFGFKVPIHYEEKQKFSTLMQQQ
jgi:LEA14-like dessication related protein